MDQSLPTVFLEAARRFPDRAAVVGEGGVITYARLAADVERLAGRLGELGLTGRRVGILLPNLPATPLALYALLRAGGSALLLNPMNAPREVAEQLQDAAVDTVVTTQAMLGLLPHGIRALLVEDLPAALRVLGASEERVVALDDAPPPGPLPAGGDREAVVVFTSANAGRARGAVLTHRNLVANLRSTVEAMQLGPDDRLIGALPWVHAFGLTVCLNAPLSTGAALVPVERFNPLRLLELLEASGATVFAGVPAMCIGLLAAVERRGPPRHSLRVTLCGGAPLAPSVQAAWERTLGLALRQGYGLTEAGPVCLFNRVDRPNRPGTLGYPFTGVEVTIRDPGGAELPVGEVGEICVRGDNVFAGYLNDGGRRPADFFGAWLRTGDLGSLEPDGAVRFRGLLKPMFTRNGFNVYPREVERVLRSDPRVAAASAYSLPDPVRENELIVSVVAAAGTPLTEDDVRELCRAQLASYKQPARIQILSSNREHHGG